MKRLQTHVAVLGLVALCGCVADEFLAGPGPGPVGVEIVFPMDQVDPETGESPLTGSSFIETCALYSQSSLNDACWITTVEQGVPALTGVQFGKPLQISIEARATRARGTPLAFGQSEPMILDGNETSWATVSVSRVDRFHIPTDRTSCADTLCGSSRLRTPRKDFTATMLHDGRVLITGGRDSSNTILDSAEIFDPADGTFRYVASRLNFARAGHAAVRLGSSYGYRVLILGGEDGDQQWRIAEYYDPATNGFYNMDSPMTSSRVNFTAARLNDGRVLLAGGWKGAAGSEEYLDSMEIFNPARDEFQEVDAVLSAGRAYHTATLTTLDRPSSQVLIAGGKRGLTVLSSADVVDIGNMSTDAAVTPLNMNEPRWGHAAVRVGFGDKVLIVGGSSQAAVGIVGILSSMEMFTGYDVPAFKDWNAVDGIPELSIGRWGLTVTPLEPDPASVGVTTRALLVVGGLDAASNSVAQAELLIPDDPENPQTFKVDGFTSTPERVLHTSRYGHRDLKLASGKVIVMGGLWRASNVEVLPSAEIYEPGPTDWCGSRACSDW